MNENISSPQPLSTSKDRKGGRPPLPAEEKRTCRKVVYYTEEDGQKIDFAAEENRMSDSEYINNMSLTGKVVAPVSPDFARDFRAVAGAVNNLNQLVHLAHNYGLPGLAQQANDVLAELKPIVHVIYLAL